MVHPGEVSPHHPSRVNLRCEDGDALGLTVQPDSSDGPAAPAVRRGIVSRRELFERLREAGRVVHLTAPAGSGKTILLRSWIGEAGLAGSAAWVAIGPDQGDPQRFWVSVADALRHTTRGAKLVKALTAAPNLDAWDVVERLLTDLGRLEDRIWLVIDDLHELRVDETLKQLELLMMRAPTSLRFVLAARHDLRLGLHRVRLEGELTEIRAADLRFGLADARALFEAAEVKLSDPALQMLVERTEGWVAGLRLAALSLRGHADPEHFAAEFSGTERTVADYLLAEVLERQPADVRQLLLRTSILERVCGPLADSLTGAAGSERILHQLEEANAFVFSVDPARSWFRYHRLLADLLQLELRRTEAGELGTLHRAAADWFAAHEYPLEAIRHFQAGDGWDQAARLLFENSLALQLDGQGATTRELLGRFPPRVAASSPELAMLTAADLVLRGSAEQAETQIGIAARATPSVAPDRRGRFEVSLAILRLILGNRTGNLPAVIEEAERLLGPAEALGASHHGADDDLRAVALTSLGVAELWLHRVEAAERHLEEAVALAAHSQHPYLETSATAHWAMAARLRSLTLTVKRGLRAVELAERHGWTEEPIMYPAYVALGMALVGQGRLDEGERWLEKAERLVRAEGEPTTVMTLHLARGILEVARGREREALAVFRAAERPAESIVTTHTLAAQARALSLHALLRVGETKRVEDVLAGIDSGERDGGDMRTVVAALHLVRGDAQGATAALAPVIDGSVPITNRFRFADALMLDAIAKDAGGDAEGAHRTLEQVLDLAEPDGALVAFMLNPAPALLERHARRRTAHAALISEILNLLSGGTSASAQQRAPMLEPLSQSETRILRYLPTNLSVPEIAEQTYLSANTVKTHMRHLYEKLGAHSRGEAVMRARALALLAPSRHQSRPA